MRHALLGSFAGAAVLGLGGRLLMRLIALATTGTGGFSVGGTFEVVAAGSLFGALGGLLLWVLPRRLARLRPLVLTGLLFVAVTVTSGAARGAASGIPLVPRVGALAAFAGLIYMFALLLARAPQLNCSSRPTTG